MATKFETLLIQLSKDTVNAATTKVKEAFAGVFTIPQIEDETSEEEVKPHIPEFTKEEWVFECLKKYIKATVRRWDAKKKKMEIEVSPDGEIDL